MFVVRPEYRGKAVGSALFQRALEQCMPNIFLFSGKRLCFAVQWLVANRSTGKIHGHSTRSIFKKDSPMSKGSFSEYIPGAGSVP